ncbi:MAG: tetratricopeptide repeat protein [Thermoguttaceae bacterium]|nr:tetratricopeptide repeat protein [Thermoguttaceae bacterium]
MRVVFSPLSLWPGFAGVVRRGLWDQLALALLFGALAQATLFVNFFWSDYLSGYLRASTVVVFAIAWIFLGFVASGRLKRYEKSLLYDAEGELFLEAQTRYLRGEWFEAECALKSVLKKNPSDAEALLLLATLCRHVKRFAEARQTLAALEKLEAADYWRYEIGLEKEAIQADIRALREERLAEREQAETEAVDATSSVAQELEPTPATAEAPTQPVQPPTLETNDENVSSPDPDVVSLETVDADVGTGRPILRFCLTPNDSKADAA